MQKVSLQIPEHILFSIKIPRNKWEGELKKELAVHLYHREMISFANAHRLAEMTKIDFHHLLGERMIDRQYGVKDYEKDLSNISRWNSI